MSAEDGRTSVQTIDETLAEWLRGECDPPALHGDASCRLLHRMDLHGLGPMLALRSAGPRVAPAALHAALRERLIAREMWEAQHRRAVADALTALAGAGARPLVFKGTALAWSLYPRPAARVRGDTDILVAEDEGAAARDALAAAGFRRAPCPGGATLRAAALFRRPDPLDRLHDVDLHWRANNARVISRLFPHAALWERSAPLDGLAPGARRIGHVDALLIACVHRLKHLSGWYRTEVNGVPHPTPDSLTWLLDIDLLWRALTAGERRDLRARALAAGLARSLAAGLGAAARHLGTPVPRPVTGDLSAAPASAVDRYLGRGPLARLVMDVAALRRPGMQARFLRELLLPPEGDMRAAFSRRPSEPLAALHLRRLARGARDHVARGRMMP